MKNIFFFLVDRRIITYKISMENIAVESCTDANRYTELRLNATRIGWVYYSTDRMGKTTISSKSGWDAESQKTWTNF